MPNCPNCSQALTAVDLNDPNVPLGTAPWLCAWDSRGWWDAEIQAAAEWTPLGDFGTSLVEVAEAVQTERIVVWGPGVLGL